MQNGNQSLPQYAEAARKKREMYVGPWLPEPIRTSEEDTLETDGGPPRSAVLRHARPLGAADADRANGFRSA